MLLPYILEKYSAATGDLGVIRGTIKRFILIQFLVCFLTDLF